MHSTHESPKTLLHANSRLARLQQAIVFGTLVALAAWLYASWENSAPLALAGFGLLLLGYALVLALEFVAVAQVNRRDPAPRAGFRTFVKAWWQEVIAAPMVFSWRQPFQWRALADQDVTAVPGATAVVLVHGFVCNRGFWLPWMREMRRIGMPYTSVNLEPVFGSIDDYVPLIDDAVRRAHDLTGRTPVVVCHSMGGLAVRAWRAGTSDADERIRHIVTIGTPHSGTWLGQFTLVPNGKQMRQDSPWGRSLREREAQRWPAGAYGCFTCWYSNTDNIVFPATTATLPGADNRHLPGHPHVAMAFADTVMEGTLDLVLSLPKAAGIAGSR
jgi:pimeloyl-ACP methyl ester carboxylesterase